MSAHPHRWPVRVYYEDTDAGGVVYYANYLKFAERGRTEAMRTAGIEHEKMRRDSGHGLVVRRVAADFLLPARLDDELVVLTRVARIAGASLDLEQEIRRGDEVLARLSIVVACLDAAGRPARLPENLATALAGLSDASQTPHNSPITPKMVKTHAR